MHLTKTKSSFYRRIFIAALIERGFNTLPKIIAEIDAPRRTVQDTINALGELDIDCSFSGANKNGCYIIHSWGPINNGWVDINYKTIKAYLGY